MMQVSMNILHYLAVEIKNLPKSSIVLAGSMFKNKQLNT